MRVNCSSLDAHLLSYSVSNKLNSHQHVITSKSDFWVFICAEVTFMRKKKELAKKGVGELNLNITRTYAHDQKIVRLYYANDTRKSVLSS